MKSPLIVGGWFLLTVFVTCNTYLLYRVMQNFQENPEYASTRFFVDKRVKTAFEYMTATAVLYTVPAGGRLLQQVIVNTWNVQPLIPDPLLEQIVMVPAVILYATLFWAYYRFSTVSAKPRREN